MAGTLEGKKKCNMNKTCWKNSEEKKEPGNIILSWKLPCNFSELFFFICLVWLVFYLILECVVWISARGVFEFTAETWWLLQLCWLFSVSYCSSVFILKSVSLLKLCWVWEGPMKRDPWETTGKFILMWAVLCKFFSTFKQVFFPPFIRKGKNRKSTSS